MNEWEWRYLSRGRVVHALRRAGLTFTGHRDTALCGTSPVWFEPDGWRGTGTQAEYERAAELPTCKRCKTLGAHRPCYCHPGCSACEIGQPCPHGQEPR